MYNAISGWRWGFSIIKATPPKVPAHALIQSFHKFISYIHCYQRLEKSNTLHKLRYPNKLLQTIKIEQSLLKNLLFPFSDFINKNFTSLTISICVLRHTTRTSIKNKVLQISPLLYPKTWVPWLNTLHHADDHMFH